MEYFKYRVVVEVGPFVDLKATDLEGNLRMIDYAVNTGITPKDTQHNVIALDIENLWHVVKHNHVNFPALIIKRMRYTW